jgi:hypothetical protein
MLKFRDSKSLSEGKKASLQKNVGSGKILARPVKTLSSLRIPRPNFDWPSQKTKENFNFQVFVVFYPG